MGLTPFTFRPGINKQATPLLNEGGWSDGNLIRWNDGFLEKYKGWVDVASGKSITGVCRSILSWPQLDGKKNAALGTHLKLQVFQGGDYYDITPVDTSGTEANNPFATTNGSAIVIVTHVAHGRQATDRVIWSGAATFNNVTMNGEFAVLDVIDVDHFRVTALTVANATSSGGGAAVSYIYLLSSGIADASPGFGWGASTWGDSTWGTPRSTAIGVLNPTLWSLDTVGEDLLANRRSGGVYTWDVSGGLTSRATLLAGAPAVVNWVLMSKPERHVMCFGCEILGIFDPMLIRWSDTEIFTDFVASSTNAAGSWRLSGGSQIMAARMSAIEGLVWTDGACHRMRWTGSPYVFRFDEIGAGAGMIAPHAGMFQNGIGYWMGPQNFYRYRGGTPEEIPCPMWDDVFGNLNRLQAFKITCGINAAKSEIIWRYCSATSSEIDRYVIYNYDMDIWYSGTGMVRSAWDQADVSAFDYPVAAHPTNGKAYYHEFGENDDGMPMTWFAESGDADLEEGDFFIASDDVYPDFRLLNGGGVDISLKFRDSPTGVQTTVGPVNFTSTTQVETLRGRGRHMAVRLAGSSLNMSFRMGKPRVRMRRDGMA